MCEQSVRQSRDINGKLLFTRTNNTIQVMNRLQIFRVVHYMQASKYIHPFTFHYHKKKIFFCTQHQHPALQQSMGILENMPMIWIGMLYKKYILCTNDRFSSLFPLCCKKSFTMQYKFIHFNFRSLKIIILCNFRHCHKQQ